MFQIIQNRLIAEFKNKATFSREELFAFFRHFEPDLKEGTFSWRIYNLKKKNIIKSIQRGYYTISYKPKYKIIKDQCHSCEGRNLYLVKSGFLPSQE